MLSALRAKGLLWPAVMTVIGVMFLVALGNWQMRRLAWKEGLIVASAGPARAARHAARRSARQRRGARLASAGGWPGGRRHPPPAAESASRVRADLVRPGCGASRRVRRVCRHALAPAARLSPNYPRNLRVLTHLCAGAPRSPSFACSAPPGPLGCS